DEEKYPPRQLQQFINASKEAGLRANAVEAGDEFTRRMVAFYADYDAQCNREGVVDFAELLLRTFEVLARNLNLLQHYQNRFRYILVDEFQDTNKLQYKWIKLLAGTNGCVFAVGDDDQCLPAGTLVTMADGSRKPIESVKLDDQVLSCFADGTFRAATVVRTHSSYAKRDLVEITTRNGRILASTPEHSHFAYASDAELAMASPNRPMLLRSGAVRFREYQAGYIQPGMLMLQSDGMTDLVKTVERFHGQGMKVFDIDVSPTHNFVAAGLVTHNSIYRFRGAEVGNMNEFVRDFGVDEVVKLEQNYRSHGHILDAANAIIAQNKARLGKNLWTDSGKGEPLRIYAAANDDEEARFIVEEVRQLHREGNPLSEMALLYRSNAQSRILEHHLFRSGVSYKVYGGLRFFERQEVKHALAYLRLAANPDDDSAFSRVVNFPPRGIGSRTVEQVQEASERGMGSFMHSAKSGAVGGRSGSALASFVQMVEGFRSASETLTLPELITEIIERSQLHAYYQAEKEGQDRLENLNELVNAAALFAEDFEHGVEPAGESQEDVAPVPGTYNQQVLAAFLSHASLEAGEHEASAGQDALQLMTVHSAKGLEFNAVFISGLEEGLFPHDNSMLEDGGIEEERRLMYVAITRARKRLYISYAGSRMLHGQPRYGIVSRFVEEIPANLCKWLVLPEKQFENRGGYQASFGGMGNSGGAWSSGGGRAPQADSSRYQSAQRAPFETKRPDEIPFSIGQNVVHAKFGEGVVIDFKGRGLDASVQVRFAAAGTKWLALQYAKLSPG
ncbi:MAG TPA: 3'-5' exonuclease, partial [Usitatibacter sp.]|nr:3'-5' exonuclease [Usitatibacter sp.]